MKKRIKKYCTVTLGIFLVAIAFNLFLAPYNLASNGVSGLSIIVKRFTGISEGTFILASNIILIGISYNYLGWEKTKHSIIGSILFPIFVSITSPITNFIVIENMDLLIISLLGGVISGVGYGLVYQNDYTTGGTDILNQLMEKYCKVPMGKSIIYVDGMVVLLGFITFGFTTMLYSMIVLFLISELSNRTMLKINYNQILFIQSKKIEEIKTLLTKEFTYDVTLLNTTGGYSKEKRKTLFCAISKKDYYMIKESILLIDKNAFITVVTAYETQNGNKSLKAHIKEINTQES